MCWAKRGKKRAFCSKVTSKAVLLKPGRERSLLRRHPWVFSGAIQSVQGEPQPGETVAVFDSGRQFLGWGAYSPRSQISVRMWSWDEAEEVSSELLLRRLRRAVATRSVPGLSTSRPTTTACRLVNAESDGLPGLVVDRYGDYAVCQFLSAGSEFWKPVIVAALASGELPGLRGGYERSDVDVREKEGLPPITGPLFGEPPPELIEIEEHGALFLVDVRAGHKTGFYLDQRENRRLVGELAAGREVLNAFAYTGGFAVTALKGGAAHCTNVDSSSPALDLARANLALNGLLDSACSNVEADVFGYLRQCRDAGRDYDLIILDPPKFAHSAGQVEKASRAYKDINLLALKLLRPGGVLATFSCSGAVSADLFQKIVQGAALDAGREARITGRLTQAADHPVALTFPEAEYLKGLVLLAD